MDTTEPLASSGTDLALSEWVCPCGYFRVSFRANYTGTTSFAQCPFCERVAEILPEYKESK